MSRRLNAVHFTALWLLSVAMNAQAGEGGNGQPYACVHACFMPASPPPELPRPLRRGRIRSWSSQFGQALAPGSQLASRMHAGFGGIVGGVGEAAVPVVVGGAIGSGNIATGVAGLGGAPCDFACQAAAQGTPLGTTTGSPPHSPPPPVPSSSITASGSIVLLVVTFLSIVLTGFF